MNLEINIFSKEKIQESFCRIAKELFENYRLNINGNYYRLIDIEFYFNHPVFNNDKYPHCHELQFKKEQWYFHGSGIDITIGQLGMPGGILIRDIARLYDAPMLKNDFMKEAIGGPNLVKTEIFSNFKEVFSGYSNIMRFEDIHSDRSNSYIKIPDYIIKTHRLGLNPNSDNKEDKFHREKLRYVIFPYLKNIRNKIQIATDMKTQFNLSNEEIKKYFGYKILS